MQLLKIATAVTVKLGPFVDATDGVTAETGLTISQADIRLSKNGGAFAQTNDANGATHDENGYYDVPLDTTDTGTVGRLRVSVSVAGALPVWQDFMVVPANVYDSLVLGTDLLDVTADEVNDKTGYSLIDGAITASKISTYAITADKIAADAVTKVQAGLSTLTAQDVADAAKLTPSPGDPHLGSLKSQVDICASDANKAALYSTLVHQRLPANPAAVGSAMTLAPDAIAAIEATIGPISETLSRIESNTSAGTITVRSFVADDGSAIIYSGMDHVGVMALSWSVEGWHGPDLSAGSVVLRLISRRRWQENIRIADFEFAAEASMVGQNGTIVVELTREKSGQLVIGQQAYRYQLVHVAATGGVTLIQEGWADINNVMDVPE